jgi:hypothetical protein
LWKKVSCPFDGAGNQQREKTDEDGIVDEVLFWFDPVFVNINHIRQAVEGVK